ncbi:molybdopterin-guanine dinucleotide biosynthesis protein B [Aestuariispira insulae]|uniref:Molybdopterin guanine dinucleotide biosynthesis accessory protein MobB n=1 Tax=Aestuariispira insulae TaxID=1461337 RepID=A0A3D9HY28_9PROT|nr:molybdopterin-guanine dinucleotide biosynthesis protein B [Aestuariispira insulae]RED54319.1 molybdopterin guanine dinucleotide biosynthesis accessory protein MobB [Aestuariispira insulae]
MKVFGLAGWSGSGKTTLAVKLIQELISRGLEVSTVKHAHHNFDVDKPGKDSFEHRQAGASEVMVSSANRFALMRELRGAPEPSLEELIAVMKPVDLLLVEGFKFGSHPKLEVYRPSTGKSILAEKDPHIVAVASDEDCQVDGRPVLDLNDVPTIADFIMDHMALQAEDGNRGAAE